MKEFIERLRKNTSLGNLIHSRGDSYEDQKELIQGFKYHQYEAREALKKEITEHLEIIDEKILNMIRREFEYYILDELLKGEIEA